MTVINFDETQSYKIKQLIDIAGFNSITDKHGITLIDKNKPDADKYADLRFRTLREAIRAIQPYLIAMQYQVIA